MTPYIFSKIIPARPHDNILANKLFGSDQNLQFSLAHGDPKGNFLKPDPDEQICDLKIGTKTN